MHHGGGSGGGNPSGLRGALRRRLVRRFGSGAGGRAAAAGALRAAGVLVRRHPSVAAEVAGAGLAEAGRVGLAEFRRWLAADPQAKAEKARPSRRLKRGDLRRLRKLLAANERSRRGTEPVGDEG